MFLWNHIKVNPLTVCTCNHSFCTEYISVRAVLFKSLQNCTDLILCISMNCLFAPACKHIICMMMVMMIVTAAAFAVVMVVMLMLVFIIVLVMMPAAWADRSGRLFRFIEENFRVGFDFLHLRVRRLANFLEAVVRRFQCDFLLHIIQRHAHHAGQLLQCGCEPWRWKLTQNLLRIAARKNLGLAQRSLYTAPKTIRGRITAYFSVLARQNGSLRFTLPFDRQQLADHLGVDRSALSNALSQMQREGLLVIDKREVELKQVEEM